jgi:hypothetical protein
VLKRSLPFSWRKRLTNGAMDEVNAGLQVETTGGPQPKE